MTESSLGKKILALNTIAFTVCFAVWTMYGVLATFLVDNQILAIDKAALGWLIGMPVLSGSVLRLPVGLLTDKYGGKPVFIGVMLVSALGTLFTAMATEFWQFVACGLVFGIAGTGFAVGIAYTSVFWPREKQGTALGIFGIGNAGSAVTTLLSPLILKNLTNGGQNPEGWRILPLIYGGSLVAMTVIFALTTTNRRPEGTNQKSMADRLRPLKDARVWRFGVYYFLVFGAFVALSQWLVPYYLSVYSMSLATAGLMASIFSLPSGLIRALGGWASDKFGARATMYWVLSSCALLFALVIAPRMDISSPGESVMADRAGTVVSISPGEIKVGEKAYKFKAATMDDTQADRLSSNTSSLQEGTLIWPQRASWQEPVVQVGQTVKKKELLARGITHVYFQANVWVFTAIVFLAGIMMGIGKAAVYRHIPDYFPHDVGVVGGLVGVIGGLGGFFCPVLFGYLLRLTGLWTSCWLFLAVLSAFCLVWMHLVILRMVRHQTDH